MSACRKRLTAFCEPFKIRVFMLCYLKSLLLTKVGFVVSGVGGL